jgi:hypothetical protein
MKRTRFTRLLPTISAFAGTLAFSPVAHAVYQGISPEQISDSMIASVRTDDPETCSRTLLTNNWVLSAGHCRSFAGGTNYVDVFYNKSCNTDADCAPRGGQCVWSSDPTGTGKSCGLQVAKFYDSPYVGDPSGRNQVNLWQLTRSFPAATKSGNFTIAQPVYFGPKSNLVGKEISIVGTACGPSPWATPAMGTFTVSGTAKWSYTVDPVGGNGLLQGDSGGPGYWTLGNTNFLAGTTVTAGDLDASHPCRSSGGSQHDITEVQAWFDDMLFDTPRVVRSGVQGYAQAMNSSDTNPAAVSAHLSNNRIFYSFCQSEPCDDRGWSAPVILPGSSELAPSIAVDTVNGSPGAQIFLNIRSSISVFEIANNVSNGAVVLGGGCSGPPSAYTRPNTSPRLIEVACLAMDGNIRYNWRNNGSWTGWASLGKPSVGIRDGTAPALVGRDAKTVTIAAVGKDGAVWVISGASGVGWTPWTSVAGRGIVQVAAATYAPNRIDLIAIVSTGDMYHKFYDAGWSPNWLQITRGRWSNERTPFAASYSGDLARLSGLHRPLW